MLPLASLQFTVAVLVMTVPSDVCPAAGAMAMATVKPGKGQSPGYPNSCARASFFTPFPVE